MISAVEALTLPRAKLTEADVRQFRDALARVDHHVHETITFSGPTPIVISTNDLSKAAATALAVVLNQRNWFVQIQQSSSKDAWVLNLVAKHEAYMTVAALAEFLLPS